MLQCCRDLCGCCCRFTKTASGDPRWSAKPSTSSSLDNMTVMSSSVSEGWFTFHLETTSSEHSNTNLSKSSSAKNTLWQYSGTLIHTPSQPCNAKRDTHLAHCSLQQVHLFTNSVSPAMQKVTLIYQLGRPHNTLIYPSEALKWFMALKVTTTSAPSILWLWQILYSCRVLVFSTVIFIGHMQEMVYRTTSSPQK